MRKKGQITSHRKCGGITMIYDITDLINYHGTMTSIYAEVLLAQEKSLIYLQFNSSTPRHDTYFYKIEGKIKFQNTDWYDGNDNIHHYQVWSITKKSENVYYIEFDIGTTELIAQEVEITPITSDEFPT